MYPKRLRQLPGSKYFLYLVRDPINRIESHIAHNIGKGRLSVDEAMRLKDFSNYVFVSSYATQLENYHIAFPHLPVRVLDFEQIKADPLAVVRQDCVALEIDPDFRFKQISPKNTRKAENGAKKFSLTSVVSDEIRVQLANEMRRFHAMSGFDVSRGDFDIN